MSDTPNPPLWYVPLGGIPSVVANGRVDLEVAKDIPLFVRHNISVRLDFFPFNQWERALVALEKHICDEEGRFYRYDLWHGRLSFARDKEDVKDAPDSDWPVRSLPKPGSKRWRRKHVMEAMIADMGCRRAMSQGMQDIAMCRAVQREKLSGDVVKAQRAVMYFQNIHDAGLGGFKVDDDG